MYSKNIFIQVCKTCHKKFKTTSRHARFCSDECRIYNSAKIRHQQAYNELCDILKEIDIYNKEHGTKLSYGQYMSGRRW